MLRQIVFVVVIAFCASVISFAQDKPVVEKKDSLKKIEVNKNQKETTSIGTKKAWNKVCPVKGEEVDAESPTVIYNGKVYGFCCPGCDKKFAKDPKKFSKNLSEDGKRFIGKK